MTPRLSTSTTYGVKPTCRSCVEQGHLLGELVLAELARDRVGQRAGHVEGDEVDQPAVLLEHRVDLGTLIVRRVLRRIVEEHEHRLVRGDVVA